MRKIRRAAVLLAAAGLVASAGVFIGGGGAASAQTPMYPMGPYGGMSYPMSPSGSGTSINPYGSVAGYSGAMAYPMTSYGGATTSNKLTGQGQYCADGAEQIWVPAGTSAEALGCSGSAQSSTAAAQLTTTVGVSQNSSLGSILVDSRGMTLYVFSLDTSGMSNCSGPCVGAWPPFQPPAGSLTAPGSASGTLASMTRADGTQQVTYNGMPLYFFAGDKNPGDTHGQGIQPPSPSAFGGSWSAATP